MPAEPKTLGNVTADDFRPLQGESFAFELGPERTISVLLLDVTERAAHRRPSASRNPFSIIVRAPAGTSAPQGIYGLSHPALGRLAPFFSDIGPDVEGRCYQAVFS
ncbi:MAG: hypothetical protein HY901_24850 [Deltaproteobacteria bacterium]|nr:hypothetical protein [Deltaproteobacteria bacterium]